MTDIDDALATRLRQAIRQLRDLPGNLEAEDDPAFTTEQVNYLEKRLYELRSLLETDLPPPHPADINLHVHQLLAEHRQIAAIWSIEDVQGVRPYLTDDQAWEVLQLVGDKADAEWGITWVTLETIADELFPEPANA